MLFLVVTSGRFPLFGALASALAFSRSACRLSDRDCFRGSSDFVAVAVVDRGALYPQATALLWSQVQNTMVSSLYIRYLPERPLPAGALRDIVYWKYLSKVDRGPVSDIRGNGENSEIPQ